MVTDYKGDEWANLDPEEGLGRECAENRWTVFGIVPTDEDMRRLTHKKGETVKINGKTVRFERMYKAFNDIDGQPLPGENLIVLVEEYHGESGMG